MNQWHSIFRMTQVCLSSGLIVSLDISHIQDILHTSWTCQRLLRGQCGSTLYWLSSESSALWLESSMFTCCLNNTHHSPRVISLPDLLSSVSKTNRLINLSSFSFSSVDWDLADAKEGVIMGMGCISIGVIFNTPTYPPTKIMGVSPRPGHSHFYTPKLAKDGCASTALLHYVSW